MAIKVSEQVIEVFSDFYELFDTQRGIKAYNGSVMPNINSCSNEWNTYSATTGALYAAQRTYDYYLQKYNREYPGEGNDFKPTTVFYNPLDIYVYQDDNMGTHYEQVSHSIETFKVAGYNLDATVDFIGHEITHGVMTRLINPSALIPTYETRSSNIGEAGALSESFGDIFGTCIEKFVGSETFDWTIGENTGAVEISMSNPNNYSYPSIYAGTYWINPANIAPSNDFGGIHINSGVQNKWFYLLSEGGTQNSTTVTGLGINTAEKIAYRNMAVYAQNQWNYNDARNGSIQAAIDLYGFCSNEVRQVRNAWKAVGVGGNTDNNTPCMTITQSNFSDCLVDGVRTVTFTCNPYPVNLATSWTASNGLWTGIVINNNTITIGNTKFKNGTVTAKIVTAPNISLTRGISYTNCGANCPPPCRQRIASNNDTNNTYAQDTEGLNLQIRPNPADNSVKISMPTATTSLNKKILTLFNIQGVKLYDVIFTDAETSISISQLNDGFYIL